MECSGKPWTQGADETPPRIELSMLHALKTDTRRQERLHQQLEPFGIA